MTSILLFVLVGLVGLGLATVGAVIGATHLRRTAGGGR